MDDSILFCAPKQGGILQNSGFLDLKSLMSLGQTCKANTIDERSLILLIENEITRDHKVQTKEEAITLLRQVCRYPMLRQWLERDDLAAVIGTATMTKLRQDMLSPAASYYGVMFIKMLRMFPQTERFQIMSEQSDRIGRSLLHSAARSGDIHSIRGVLALFPESQHMEIVTMRDDKGRTALHWAAFARNPETVKYLLSVMSDDEQCFQAVTMQNAEGENVLHNAVLSVESVEAIVSALPEARLGSHDHARPL